MPRNDRKRRVPGNSACLPTKLKSRSVVDLITSGVDVSGADEYCRPKPSTKTATITGSSATSPDFLGNLIAPPILVLTNDQEKLVSSVFTCWLVCNAFTRGYLAFYSVLFGILSFWIFLDRTLPDLTNWENFRYDKYYFIYSFIYLLWFWLVFWWLVWRGLLKLYCS